MIIYYSVFVFSLVLAAISIPGGRFSDGVTSSGRVDEGPARPKLFLYTFSGIVLVSMLSLREGVGTDYRDVYVVGYEQYLLNGFSRFEPGYTAIMFLCRAIGADYHAVFLIAAVLTVGSVYLSVYRSSAEPVWSLYVFVFGGLFFFSTNGIRQAIAIGILLNAVVYLRKGDLKKYVIVVLLASLFHVFSLVFLVVYPLRNWKVLSVRTVIVVALSGMLAGYITRIALLVGGRLSPQVERYASSEALTTQYLSGNNLDISDLVLCAVPLILYGTCRKKIGDGDRGRDLDRLFIPLLFGVIACVLSWKLALFSRVATYFSPFAIIAVPNLFQDLMEADVDVRKYKTAYGVFLALSSIVLFGILNFSSVNPYVPMEGIF